MSKNEIIDEVITVADDVEKGYFYLENRQFRGPFEKGELASQAARKSCQSDIPGECRAIYHGSVRTNPATNLREPLADMHQIDTA